MDKIKEAINRALATMNELRNDPEWSGTASNSIDEITTALLEMLEDDTKPKVIRINHEQKTAVLGYDLWREGDHYVWRLGERPPIARYWHPSEGHAVEHLWLTIPTPDANARERAERIIDAVQWQTDNHLPRDGETADQQQRRLLIDTIAAAIAAEREACLRIVEHWVPPSNRPATANEAVYAIAAAIRARSTIADGQDREK